MEQTRFFFFFFPRVTDLSRPVKSERPILQAVGLFYKSQDGLGGSEASQLDV